MALTSTPIEVMRNYTPLTEIHVPLFQLHDCTMAVSVSVGFVHSAPQHVKTVQVHTPDWPIAIGRH